MSFDVAPEVYDSFMGRFSVPLADSFVQWARLPEDGRALDVGCGTGALTAALARRFGMSEVAAVDPSESFVRATAGKFHLADVRHGTAEALPFEDGVFSAALAQLVVHFMTDAAAGTREMVRVTRPGGVVAACVWDLENDRAPYSGFLRAARTETGTSAGGPGRPGTRQGDLARLLEGAGCREVSDTALEVSVVYPDFDDWWESQTHATGTASGALDGLDQAAVARVRAHALADLGDGPFAVTATAWAARGTA